MNEDQKPRPSPEELVTNNVIEFPPLQTAVLYLKASNMDVSLTNTKTDKKTNKKGHNKQKKKELVDLDFSGSKNQTSHRFKIQDPG